MRTQSLMSRAGAHTSSRSPEHLVAKGARGLSKGMADSQHFPPNGGCHSSSDSSSNSDSSASSSAFGLADGFNSSSKSSSSTSSSASRSSSHTNPAEV